MENRIKFIDYAKGIGIILVLLGHSEIIGLPKIWLYSFHMPLFFFLTGLVININLKRYKSFIKKRIKSLLIPFFCFSIILLFKDFLLIIIGNKDFNEIFYDLLGTLLQMRATDFSGSFWFLPVIFEVNIILLIEEYISSKIKRKYTEYIFSLICFIIGYTVITVLKYPLLWNFDAALIATSFAILGKCTKNIFIKSSINISLLKKYKLIVGFLLINFIVGLINSILINNSIDLYWSRLGNPIFYLIAAYAGIFMILIFSMIIKSSYLNFAGQNSLLFYCIHHEFLFPIIKNFLYLFNVDETFFYYPYIITIIMCITLIPFCKIINRYIPILAGKY